MKNALQREMVKLRQLFLGLCTSAEPNHSLSTLSGSRSSHKMVLHGVEMVSSAISPLQAWCEFPQEEA